MKITRSISDTGTERTEFEFTQAAGRRCGGCTLCCKLLPVEEIGKHAGERCRHQRWGKGCAVYRRGLPVSCSLWSCAWLADAGAAGLPRPDRAHYVVDIVADTVRVVPHDGTPPTLLSVIQVWLDPAFPEAHRDPALRAYIEARAMPALIRLNSKDAFILSPPNCSPSGQWEEVMTNLNLAVPGANWSKMPGRLRLL